MPVVCIAGMHRSGTSLVARLLNLCGVYLGKEQELVSPAEDNPDGFWENLQFYEINDSLLSQFNATWSSPPSADSILEMQKPSRPLKKKAQLLIDSLHAHSLWGWKDPRNSLTLPFWQQLIPGLKVIICLRNPLEVAHSLARRDKFDIAFSLELWHTYNQRLCSMVAQDDRVTTHYDVYSMNPQAELRRLLAFIGTRANAKIIAAACTVAKQSLQHNRSSLESLLAAGAPLEVVSLYADLCSQAGPIYWTALRNRPSRLARARAHDGRDLEYGLLTRLVAKDPIVLALVEHLSDKERALTAQLAARNPSAHGFLPQLSPILNRTAFRIALVYRRALFWIAPPNSRRARELRRLRNTLRRRLGR